MYSKFKVVAAVVMMAAAVLMSPAVPAGAAADTVTIRNIETGDCLDQHYNANNAPTTTVYSWPDPCHDFGNQEWFFFRVDGNASLVVNERSGWCLSAPNGAGSRVYAEVCVASPIPNKQIWTATLTSFGSRILVNRLTGQCLRQGPGADVYVARCNSGVATQRWQVL